MPGQGSLTNTRTGPHLFFFSAAAHFQKGRKRAQDSNHQLQTADPFCLEGLFEIQEYYNCNRQNLVKEVHYSFKGKSYFAIGLENGSGGWELRNKYYKNSSSPKDITHIKSGTTKLIITEGMFDLLSILDWNETWKWNMIFWY